MKAIQKWNPFYVEDVRKVVDAIEGPLAKRKQFTAQELCEELGLYATGILRMLARRGVLAAQAPALPWKSSGR